MLVGSGLIINVCFKDHFGRARPKQILEFGGDKKFTKVFIPSDQCSKNCSFSSGHAAGAFEFTTLAFIAPLSLRVIAFVLGFTGGMIVGACRVMQGGHFPSDVFVSGAVVLLVNYILIIAYNKLVTRSGKKTKQE
ncbi:MAG: phosphatase PAP2 family protein [Rickettsiaceae bacterium]|nr:phosphatase PAP2 family protein [Rickettsiaceae bacterium]